MARWQYHVVNLGTINAAERMSAAFGHLGSEGWELVAMYDKSSNWLAGMEKGFAIFKRSVPDGEEPDGPWGQSKSAADIAPDPLGKHPGMWCSKGHHAECSQRSCTCACHTVDAG